MNCVQLSSGLVVPASSIPAPRPTCFDFFCGAGGFSLGMLQAGFEVVGACDNDPAAAVTYLMNLGAYPIHMHFVEPSDRERLEKHLKPIYRTDRSPDFFRSGKHRPAHIPGVRHFWFGDARKLTGAAILRELGMARGELDCVVGGPPCQGFSRAGKRDVMDPRSSLVFEFARLVCEMQPRTMVMENVAGIVDMVTPEGLDVVSALCNVLESGGIGTFEALKRSLTSSAGVGAAFRGKPSEAKKPRPHTKKAKKTPCPPGVTANSPEQKGKKTADAAQGELFSCASPESEAR